MILTTKATATFLFLRIVIPRPNSLNISFLVMRCASTSPPFLSLTKNIAINPPIKMKINDDHKVPISPMIGIEKLGKYEPSTPIPIEYIAQNQPIL